MTVPAPPQVRQVFEIEKKPWLPEVTPRPLQSGQILGDVPGAAPVPWHAVQPTALTTGTLSVTPRSASSNDTRTATSMSAPRGCGGGCAPAPPARRLPRLNSPPN